MPHNSVLFVVLCKSFQEEQSAICVMIVHNDWIHTCHDCPQQLNTKADLRCHKSQAMVDNSAWTTRVDLLHMYIYYVLCKYISVF